ILIADDHEVVRRGLRDLLEDEEDLQVVGEAATGQQAVELAQAERPDLVIMDIRMPDGDGIDACRRIRQALPGTRVIMLTSYGDEEVLVPSILAGADGYLLKEASSSELISAIRQVASGRSLLDPQVTGKVLEEMRHLAKEAQPGPPPGASPAPPPGRPDDPAKPATPPQGLAALAPLTDQEWRVLYLVAQGRTNREIASALFLTEKTVRNYVSTVLSKLGVSNRTEAAAWLLRHLPLGALPAGGGLDEKG
ncbi:MAG: response regulator transcription factor, partial [Firmicutes bacterium]|nr:response regulator transcription factor [Bacillota bacterium]